MAILCTINNYGSGIAIKLCDIFSLLFEIWILLACFHTVLLIVVRRMVKYIKTVSWRLIIITCANHCSTKSQITGMQAHYAHPYLNFSPLIHHPHPLPGGKLPFRKSLAKTVRLRRPQMLTLTTGIYTRSHILTRKEIDVFCFSK